MIFHDQAALRRHVQSVLEPGSASAVLDLGCGHGTDLIEIGKLTGSDVALVGLDTSTTSIEAARKLAGADRRFTFMKADVAERLPFDDCSFDRVFSLNLLECIPDKQALLAEVERVLRPEGLVVFAHFDWDSQMLDGEDKDLVRTIVHSFADWQQKWMADADAWMGRRLWRTFQQCRLFEGAVHAALLANTRFEPGAYGWERIRDFGSLVRHGKICEAEYRRFYRAIEELAGRDEYLYTITMFIYAGTKRASGA